MGPRFRLRGRACAHCGERLGEGPYLVVFGQVFCTGVACMVRALGRGPTPGARIRRDP